MGRCIAEIVALLASGEHQGAALVRFGIKCAMISLYRALHPMRTAVHIHSVSMLGRCVAEILALLASGEHQGAAQNANS